MTKRTSFGICSSTLTETEKTEQVFDYGNMNKEQKYILIDVVISTDSKIFGEAIVKVRTRILISRSAGCGE